MPSVTVFAAGRLSPREAAFAITGRDGLRDHPVPLDHPQVVILKELARTGKKGWRNAGDYETCRFAALMILFAEFAPKRVGDVVSLVVYEELGRIAEAGGS